MKLSPIVCFAVTWVAGSLATASGWGGESAASSRVARRTECNVLFIAVDDLRCELGCYGHKLVQSPNIDRLAAEGTRFERAYCMVAVCGASRAAMMTGIRPTRTRFVGYLTRAAEDTPSAVTINTYFKEHGYYTLNDGKMFHHADDNNHGWSEPAWRPHRAAGVSTYHRPENRRPQGRNKNGKSRGAPYECAAVADNAYQDGATADKSIADMRRLAKMDKPFFLAVGFLKPHLPFVAPQKYWDLYDPAEIALPENYRDAPKDAPACSIHNWGELRAYRGVPKQGPVSDEMARKLIHGYYACVSYTDAQIGRLLDELQRLGIADKTVVVLWGDLGWNLGEHTLWCKHCVYENSMHAPLIIRAPGMARANCVAALVEFIDVYPTLCELAGLPTFDQLEGRSLVPLLDKEQVAWKEFAVGRFVTGDTIRSDRYRYSEFHDKRGRMLGRMLYDHHADPRENANLVQQPENGALVERLSRELHKYME
jgi:iduronate 2-sulfatase